MIEFTFNLDDYLEKKEGKNLTKTLRKAYENKKISIK